MGKAKKWKHTRRGPVESITRLPTQARKELGDDAESNCEKNSGFPGPMRLPVFYRPQRR